MVGGLFGVHNIDMGMCSSFARVFDIRKKKSFFYIYYLSWDGCCRIATFLSLQSIFLLPCASIFPFLFCIAWPLFSCKVGMAGHMCALGMRCELRCFCVRIY